MGRIDGVVKSVVTASTLDIEAIFLDHDNVCEAVALVAMIV